MSRRSTKHEARPAKKSAPFSALEGANLLGELLRQELERLQKPGKKMTDTQRGTLMRRCSTMIRELGEITGETLELPESKLVRMPQLRRLFQRVIAALEPWPEALAAASAALTEIERGDAPGSERAA